MCLRSGRPFQTPPSPPCLHAPACLHTWLAVCTLLLACVDGRDRFGELQGLRADVSQHAEDAFTEVAPLKEVPTEILKQVQQPSPRRSYVHYADSTLQERVAKAIRRTAGECLAMPDWFVSLVCRRSFEPIANRSECRAFSIDRVSLVTDFIKPIQADSCLMCFSYHAWIDTISWDIEPPRQAV